jgi:DNA-binding transcriptional LysR family regulator
MKLSQCVALVTVADSGGFTKAAAVLGMSQSAVSHSIARLEEELGRTLLERDRGGVRLTECGREVLGHARALTAHADRIAEVARASREGLRGTVRFATSQSFGLRFLPHVLSRFRASYPGQEVDLREGSDQQISQWLRRQSVDIGVVTLPKDDLVTVPLWSDEMLLLTADGHRLAGAPAVPVRQLIGEPLLMPVGGVEPVIRAAMRVAGCEPTVPHRLRDLNSLLAMVAEGLGVTVLPTSALSALPPGVTPVRLVPRVSRHVGLATRPGARASVAVTALIDIARELAALHTAAAG